MLSRCAPLFVIVGLGLLFFGELLHSGYTLYADHSDLLAYHIPVRRFLVRTWQETGELPLWSPYSFSGIPFVHDIQVTAFYPPQAILYALPDEHVGIALSWLVVLHVIAAGLCMYGYACAHGLGRGGALVAGIGYMFAGKWMFHLLAAGHLNFAPLAWLPLVLLLLEGASRRGSVLRAGWAGAVFAMIVLGTHPQLTFYAGLFVGLWTLGPALERAGYFSDGGMRSWRRTAAALGQWALYGAVAVTIAIALSAVQLLPTLEATDQTSRASTQVLSESGSHTFWSFNLRRAGSALLWLVGPGDVKFGGWETRGGLGLTWLMAAALAVVGGRGRVRFQAVVGLLLILFALGGWVAFQGLPGFRLFRLPSRMVLLTELPLALLAGTATDWLFVARERPAWLGRSAWVVGGVLALGALLFVGQILYAGPRLYWAVAGVAVAVILVLLYRFSGAVTPAWKLAWGAVLLAEAWVLARPMMALRPEANLYVPSKCARYVAAQRQIHGRVLDRDVPGKADSAPVGYVLPLLMNIESVRGYNPFEVHQYKQYLHFISDDDSEAGPSGMVGNFTVKNKALLDLLGVRYLVQPASVPVETGGWQPVTTDAHPHAYCLFAGGVRQMPPYIVYENEETFPRAFFVPAAGPMPGREQALGTLRATDFRRKVLLEGLAPGEGVSSPNGAFRPATIRDYRPNRVTVAVESEFPGYLVLADVWFPGWSGTVNGQRATVYRANYLFRAVAVHAGLSEVVFTFDPASYRWGRLITTVTLAALALASVMAAFSALRRRASVPAAPSALQG